MKTVQFPALLSVLVFTSAMAFGQANPDRLIYQQKAEKFAKMRNGGMVLTVVGAILVVAGISSMVNSDYYHNYSSSNNTSNPHEYPVGGLLCATAGELAIAGGTVMWSLGGNKHSKYQELFNRTSVGFKLRPQQGGLSFAFRL